MPKQITRRGFLKYAASLAAIAATTSAKDVFAGTADGTYFDTSRSEHDFFRVNGSGKKVPLSINQGKYLYFRKFHAPSIQSAIFKDPSDKNKKIWLAQDVNNPKTKLIIKGIQNHRTGQYSNKYTVISKTEQGEVCVYNYKEREGGQLTFLSGKQYPNGINKHAIKIEQSNPVIDEAFVGFQNTRDDGTPNDDTPIKESVKSYVIEKLQDPTEPETTYARLRYTSKSGQRSIYIKNKGNHFSLSASLTGQPEVTLTGSLESNGNTQSLREQIFNTTEWTSFFVKQYLDAAYKELSFLKKTAFKLKYADRKVFSEDLIPPDHFDAYYNNRKAQEDHNFKYITHYLQIPAKVANRKGCNMAGPYGTQRLLDAFKGKKNAPKKKQSAPNRPKKKQVITSMPKPEGR